MRLRRPRKKSLMNCRNMANTLRAPSELQLKPPPERKNIQLATARIRIRTPTRPPRTSPFSRTRTRTAARDTRTLELGFELQLTPPWQKISKFKIQYRQSLQSTYPQYSLINQALSTVYSKLDQSLVHSKWQQSSLEPNTIWCHSVCSPCGIQRRSGNRVI